MNHPHNRLHKSSIYVHLCVQATLGAASGQLLSFSQGCVTGWVAGEDVQLISR